MHLAIGYLIWNWAGHWSWRWSFWWKYFWVWFGGSTWSSYFLIQWKLLTNSQFYSTLNLFRNMAAWPCWTHSKSVSVTQCHWWSISDCFDRFIPKCQQQHNSWFIMFRSSQGYNVVTSWLYLWVWDCSWSLHRAAKASNRSVRITILSIFCATHNIFWYPAIVFHVLPTYTSCSVLLH